MKKKNLIFILILAIILSTYYFFSSNKKVNDQVEDNDIIISHSFHDDLGLIKANNDFAFKLFKEISGQDNLFVSPFSIHTALLLAYIGSDESSKEELSRFLSIENIDDEKILDLGLSYLEFINNKNDDNELSLANALFLREGIPFLENYKHIGEKYFQAEIDKLPQKGEIINNWVKEKTNDKIESIIDAGLIPDAVIAYLVNTIYFKGIWDKEFNEEKTNLRNFYSNEIKQVEMMENVSDYKFIINESLEAVAMDYKNGSYSLLAFMPKGKSLEEFYSQISYNIFNNLLDKNKKELILRFPKFSFNSDLELKDSFISMGLISPFDDNLANFSKMVDLAHLNNVFISEIFHNAFIEIDEKGSEAAAATAVEMKLRSDSEIIEPDIIEFNHAFFFAILDNSTKNILFLGQFTNN